jgi:hypothetical protein
LLRYRSQTVGQLADSVHPSRLCPSGHFCPQLGPSELWFLVLSYISFLSKESLIFEQGVFDFGEGPFKPFEFLTVVFQGKKNFSQ